MFTADWVVDALCRTEGHPDLWFPDTAGARVQIARAKMVCRRCPVQTECLDYALSLDEKQGVWAGIHFGQTRTGVRDEMRRLRGSS
jgi:WhiB family redox-sensing transcriptional regulator